MCYPLFGNIMLSRLRSWVFRLERIVVGRALAAWLGASKILPSSLPGVHNFIARGVFLKVVLGRRRFMSDQHKNFEIIEGSFPEILPLIPPNRREEFLAGRVTVVHSDLLEPIMGREGREWAARFFLDVFRNLGRVGPVHLSKLSEAGAGLGLLRTVLDEEDFQDLEHRIQQLLRENSLRIGPCHGDFHARNFLQKGGQFFLIDFDCFRDKGVQELDAIYFIIHEIIDDQPGIWWPEAIRDFHSAMGLKERYMRFMRDYVKPEAIEGLLLLYIVDRLGQELKYGPVVLGPAKDVVLCLMRKGVHLARF